MFFFPAGSLLVLGAVLQVTQSAGSEEREESVESLDDVISSRDQARLLQVLSGAQPYDSFKEAYLISKVVVALGHTNENSKVCVVTLWCALFGV